MHLEHVGEDGDRESRYRHKYGEARERPACPLQRTEPALVIFDLFGYHVAPINEPFDRGTQPNKLLPDIPYGHHDGSVRVDD
jgi:hypothetical protein